MTRINKIDLLSTSKFCAVFMAFIGLIAGILYSFGGLIIDLVTIGLNAGTALAFLSLIGMPIIFAIPGLICGALFAMIYNLVAGAIGGIKIELSQK